MSPNAVNNFVSDLVEMAKAMDELPKVQAQLATADLTIASYETTIAQRDRQVQAQVETIAALQDQLHQVEVARDDAELRFLELDEYVGQARTFLAGATVALDVAKAVAGPEVAEFAEPQGQMTQGPAGPNILDMPEATLGESATDPTYQTAPSAISPMSEGFTLEHGGSKTMLASGNSAPVNDGVSVPADPTSGPAPTEAPATDNTSPMPSAPLGATQSADATSPTPDESKPTGPYFGKRYSEVPHCVSYKDWVAGGGTPEDRQR